MCGIHAVISTSFEHGMSSDLKRCLTNRGPDHNDAVQARISGNDQDLFLTLSSTVLSLRGDHVAEQPLIDDSSGSVLCWNGEAWAIRGESVQGNDGEAVLALLIEASRSAATDGVLEALRMIEGPFAFVYFDKQAKRIYYGRDRLGRRSLLIKTGIPFALSSIVETPVDGWSEVEADGCYTIHLEEVLATDIVPVRHDWNSDISLISSIGVFNTEVPESQPRLSPDSAAVKRLEQHLVDSLRLRVLDVPLPPSASETDARVAVLFSGGLDCTVLARLCHDIIPKKQAIDLINVAFENPRIAAQNPDLCRQELYERCPDRMTGRSAFKELGLVCLNRIWRFVAVNIPYTDNVEHRAEIIRLIYPHNTEMDLSIGSALYFASRGRGLGETLVDPKPQEYGTTARVLLSGLGADELFGGYVRHATAYNRGGYPGLVDELKLDVGRLGKRNLGRDDRVMAHWGREVRFPYLDEGFVRWAMALPVWEKCDFENPSDDTVLDPEKRLLRLLAKSLGLESVSREKKRAIQFGARTAKMESGKVKGTTLVST